MRCSRSRTPNPRARRPSLRGDTRSAPGARDAAAGACARGLLRSRRSPRRAGPAAGPCRPRRTPGYRWALLAGVGGDVLRDGLDLRVGQRALEGGHRPSAVDDLVLGDGERRFQLVEVRPDRPRRTRVRERVAARALVLEDLLAVCPADRLGGGEALEGDIRGDERGHVLGVLAANEVRRHVRRQVVGIALGGRVLPRETDLVVDDIRDRALLEALGAPPRERTVEVGPDPAGGADRRQRVTARALLLEERLAVLDIGARGDLAAGAARSETEHHRGATERGEDKPHLMQEAGLPP